MTVPRLFFDDQYLWHVLPRPNHRLSGSRALASFDFNMHPNATHDPRLNMRLCSVLEPRILEVEIPVHPAVTGSVVICGAGWSYQLWENDCEAYLSSSDKPYEAGSLFQLCSYPTSTSRNAPRSGQPL